MTSANALVTLDCTMWGIAVRHLFKHFKIGIVLLAITIALSLAWSYLSHLWFAIIVSCVGGIALLGAANRDAWRQTAQANPAPPKAIKAVKTTAPARGQRSPAASARLLATAHTLAGTAGVLPSRDTRSASTRKPMVMSGTV